MKKIVMVIIIILCSLAGLFLLFLFISNITEYNPAPTVILKDLSPGARDKTIHSGPFSLFTWNIGYAGLDAGADFILDGGKKSIGESKEIVDENLSTILKVLTNTDADFYFLQEVDWPSNRSYSIDEVKGIIHSFPSYSAWFAKNFHVLFVPYPLFQPIGPVHSGMVTLSRYGALSSFRMSLPGQYGWPVKLFHLKRCMNVLELETPVNGKRLYLVNLHLSAYDRQGELRKQQLRFVKEYLSGIYSEGHYIIAGGDWNAILPGIDKASFGQYTTEEKDLYWVQSIPGDWTPEGWQWGCDPDVPTCRSLEAPYEKGKNFLTIIDGFLISPNITLLEVKGLDLAFQNSDHNPVFIRVAIKEDREQVIKK